MPRSVTTTWKGLLKVLQELSGKPNLPADAAADAVALIEKATVSWGDETECVSRANWKQIVQEMQVPLKLATICCHTDLSSMSNSNNSSKCAYAAWHVLAFFLNRASLMLLKAKQGGIDSPKASSKSLPRRITEQFVQCGFMQRLPGILAAAAKQLQDNTAAAAADATLLQPAADGMDYYFETFNRMLDVAGMTANFQQDHVDPSVWEASATLCMSVVQRISTAMQLLPAAALGARSVYSTSLDGVLSLMFHMAEFMRLPCCLRLLKCPDVGSVLSVLVFVAYTRTLLPRTATDMASNGADSSGKLVTAAAAVAALAQQREQPGWELVMSQYMDHQPQQQQSTDACFRLTGVSMQAAAYMAAHMTSHQAQGALHCAAEFATAMSELHWSSLKEQHGQALGAQQARQHLVLAQILLRAAERQHSSSTLLKDCGPVALFASNAMKLTMHMWGKASQLAEAECRSVLCMWFAEVMPVVLQLMAHVQQQLGAGAPAAAAAAGGNSSNSSLLPEQLGKDFIDEDPVGPLVDLVGTAATFTASLWGLKAAAAAAGQPMSAELQEVLSCWQVHSAQLSTALDGLVRAQVVNVQGAIVPRHVSRMVECLSYQVLGEEEGLESTAKAAGLGSEEHLQLFSMQCSLLKLAAHMRAPFGGASAAAEACWQVAFGARAVLVEDLSQSVSMFLQGAQQPSQADAAIPNAAAIPGQPAHGHVPKAADGLTSLVLVGRCCLQWAAELYQLQQLTPDLGARLLQLSSAAEVRSAQVKQVLQVGCSHAAIAVCCKPGCAASLCLEGCQQWLQSQGVRQHLVDAGYPVEAVLQQFDATLSAMGALNSAAEAGSASAAYSDTLAQLQALGLLLNTLAVPHACNNPACNNMAGPTELASVSGKSNACAGCLTARYCNRSCQEQHWKQHKPVCKALAAAAAAPATAP